VIDPENPYVLEPHLRCAARELPIADEDHRYFGPGATAALERMGERGELTRRRDAWHDAGRESPHRQVDVRAGAGTVYTIVNADTGEVIGTADEHRAFATLHPGAVYLHMGEQFVVRELHLERGLAAVEAADPDYYTQARTVTDIEIVRELEQSRLGDVDVSFGDVLVTDQVVGFVRKLVSTNEVVDEETLDLPPQQLETRSLWFTLTGQVIDRSAITPRQLAGAIHAAEHAAIGLMPLIATCDRWDLGGVSTPMHPDTGMTTIFIHDAYPGGAGISERGFRHIERLLGATLETIRQCPCSLGCPSCVQSPKCGNGNEPLDKPAAAALLAAVLGGAWG
jgi:DEAD/DEAH box helicase domain-containing protein